VSDVTGVVAKVIPVDAESNDATRQFFNKKMQAGNEAWLQQGNEATRQRGNKGAGGDDDEFTSVKHQQKIRRNWLSAPGAQSPQSLGRRQILSSTKAHPSWTRYKSRERALPQDLFPNDWDLGALGA
jgi:hypothetical protein